MYITVLEADAGRGLGPDDDEACAAAAATAASCALADAGIELYALVVGVHAVWSTGLSEKQSTEDELVVDATHAEARRARACLMLWSMPALGTVTAMDQSGRMSVEEVDKAMTVLQAAAAIVHLTAAKAIQNALVARQRANAKAP